jgi:hypothetical protein
MKGIILAAIAAIASPAAAADQFDLVCSGRDRRDIENQRYRVDLVRKEYCSGDCQEVRPIAEVTSGMITLTRHDPSPPDQERSYNQINRTTGEWNWYWSNIRVSLRTQDVKGSCQPAAFSGFPAAKF